MSVHRILLLLLAAMAAGCGKSDREVIADNQPPRRKPNYTYGEVIQFGRGGRSQVFTAGGWSYVEPDRTWTNARSAHLAFTLPKSKRPLALRMRLAGYVREPFLPVQLVEVIANNEHVADWQVRDLADHIAIIPAATADHEQLLIELKIPRATAPRMFDPTADPRMLGITCFELAITEVDQATAQQIQQENAAMKRPKWGKSYSFGSVVMFGRDGDADRFLRSGWHAPDDRFTWTTAGPAVIELDVPPSDAPLRLRMQLAGMVDPDTAPVQRTKVFANGQEVAEWAVGEPGEFVAQIPPQVAAAKAPLKLALHVPEAVAPKQLGFGDDDRVFGVRCDALVITPAK